MSIIIGPHSLVIGIVVPLSLHVQTFNFPFCIPLTLPTCGVFVDEHVSEFIESKIWNSVLVSREPVDHLWACYVVESSVVGSCQELQSLPNHVAVEFHE